MTETERPFLATKDFNTNLAQCLLPYYVIISNLHVYSFMCMISHVHRRAPNSFAHMKSCVQKNHNL